VLSIVGSIVAEVVVCRSLVVVVVDVSVVVQPTSAITQTPRTAGISFFMTTFYQVALLRSILFRWITHSLFSKAALKDDIADVADRSGAAVGKHVRFVAAEDVKIARGNFSASIRSFQEQGPFDYEQHLVPVS
jgi:hypothetical protein